MPNAHGIPSILASKSIIVTFISLLKVRIPAKLPSHNGPFLYTNLERKTTGVPISRAGSGFI